MTTPVNGQILSGGGSKPKGIFDEILRQCVEKGLVGGAILYTDSTYIKAKANKHRKKLIRPFENSLQTISLHNKRPNSGQIYVRLIQNHNHRQSRWFDKAL